jgi:hypothetical protein
MSKEQIDKILSKWISRKLLVFLIATISLFTKHITSTDWLVIASIYLGTETAISIITEYVKNKV